MPIDISDRIIQPEKKPVRLHPVRRLIQFAIGIAIVLLPLTNGLRVDVTSGHFWLLGARFTAQNMILLFFGIALGVLVLLSVSMVYGRWWCGWICPQTLASDFGDSLKSRLKSAFRFVGQYSGISATTVWAMLMVAMAIATAAVVLDFFYPAVRVWSAFSHPLTDHRVVSHLIIVAAIIAADLLFVRRNFCRRGCPYGLMLSVIGDTKTMTVRYLWERGEDCIECGKCVTVCPMSIDIKDGPNQMECIGCGECIDACNDILPMIKSNPKPGLIELRYGIDPMRKTSRLTFAQRIGLWDLRRAFLCAVVVTLACGFALNIYGTRPTTITIVPSGTIKQIGLSLYESYDINISNGRPNDSQFVLSASGMNGMFSHDRTSVVDIARDAQKTVRVTLGAPVEDLTPGQRYPVTLMVTTVNKPIEQHLVSTFFYVPERPGILKAG